MKFDKNGVRQKMYTHFSNGSGFSHYSSVILAEVAGEPVMKWAPLNIREYDKNVALSPDNQYFFLTQADIVLKCVYICSQTLYFKLSNMLWTCEFGTD